MQRLFKSSILIFVIVIADQITKWLVRTNYRLGESTEIVSGFFNLTYVRNPGAAFGFMAHAEQPIRQVLFLLIPVVACIWLLYLIYTTRAKDKLLHISYSLILAGAIGNLIDRFALGFVVDFFDFYLGLNHFPAFNIADSSISIAAGLLILDFILHLKKKAKK